MSCTTLIYTIRDQDFELIKKWVNNIRSGVETGEIAVAPKKKAAPTTRKKAAKRKRSDSTEEDESGDESGEDANMVVEKKPEQSVSIRGRIRTHKKRDSV